MDGKWLIRWVRLGGTIKLHRRIYSHQELVKYTGNQVLVYWDNNEEERITIYECQHPPEKGFAPGIGKCVVADIAPRVYHW